MPAPSPPPMSTPVRPYAGAQVLLGITGGIASYKSAWLARLLTKAGAKVDVVMTPAATEFMGAITFEALTGRPVHTGLFDAGPRARPHQARARGDARSSSRRRRRTSSPERRPARPTICSRRACSPRRARCCSCRR